MDGELISVILPIYNVEPYLRQCLDSVCGQTYRNLQIILVDDGSPDGCGAICDEYAAKDSRITVIHKPNGGVSSARNAGLQAATGDCISWVDPDDWADDDMFEVLLTALKKYNADAAVCGFRAHHPNRTIDSGWDKAQCLGRKEALELLLENGKMQNSLCDKLWKRSFFDGIVFPEGRTYEDIAVMYSLFLKAERICCIPEIKYNYRIRSTGIVSDYALRSRVNHYLAARERYDAMAAQWPEYDDLLAAQCIASAVSIWSAYLANPASERSAYRETVRSIAGFSRSNYARTHGKIGLGLLGRVIYSLTRSDSLPAFAAAWAVGFAYRLINGRNI